MLPVLVQDEIGVLGMKAAGRSVHSAEQDGDADRVPCTTRLNLPTSTVITGIDSMKILDQALEAARTFKPHEQASCRGSARAHRTSSGHRQV